MVKQSRMRFDGFLNAYHSYSSHYCQLSMLLSVIKNLYFQK